MNDRDMRQYERFKRNQAFGQQNSGDFADGSVAKGAFADLDNAIKGLEDAKSGQIRSKDTSESTLYDSLRMDIQNIVRTANAIDQDEPGFADNFRPPKAYNPAALLTTADAFLKQFPTSNTIVPKIVGSTTTPLVDKFVAHEMDANFVVNFQNDRDAIANAKQTSEQKREGRVGDTASINPAIQQGVSACVKLDAIMHNKYASQPAKLAAWLTANHLERTAQKSKPQPAPQPAMK